MTVLSPLPAQAIPSRNVPVTVKVSSPRGIASVAYLIDSVALATIKDYPFNTTLFLEKQSAGPHTLKVIAADDQGNSVLEEVTFLLNVEPDPADFSWYDGESVSVKGSDYPRAFYLTPTRWEATKDIKILLSGGGKAERQIYNIDHNDKFENGRVFFTWNHSPGVGTYKLRAVMEDNTGRTVEKTLNVIVN